MKIIQIKTVKFNSIEYMKTVELRDKILRKPLGLKFSSEQLEKEFSDIHIASFIDKNIIGCLILSPIDKNTIQMRQVAIDDNYQGEQIGTTMVKYSEEYAKEYGYKKIILHSREVSVGFYKKLDYNIIGDRFIEIGLQHWIMEKKL